MVVLKQMSSLLVMPLAHGRFWYIDCFLLLPMILVLSVLASRLTGFGYSNRILRVFQCHLQRCTDNLALMRWTWEEILA
tara:strand:+ start:316 stop:552 length:237 start_codon:yes stop_codon:yes gene_type:complete